MKPILEKILTKETITSAGGIIVALVLAYFLWDLSGNRITSVVDAVEGVGDTIDSFKKEDLDVKKELTKALQENTKVMQTFIYSASAKPR